jgi:hypothetical protein
VVAQLIASIIEQSNAAGHCPAASDCLPAKKISMPANAFVPIDLDQLHAVIGGDAVDTGGRVGETIGKYTGAALGGVGGAIVGGLVGGPTVAGIPLGAEIGGALAGTAGRQLGAPAGRAIGRGVVQGAQWVGQQATDAWNGVRGLAAGR